MKKRNTDAGIFSRDEYLRKLEKQAVPAPGKCLFSGGLAANSNN
jgi:hypothetical protein